MSIELLEADGSTPTIVMMSEEILKLKSELFTLSKRVQDLEKERSVVATVADDATPLDIPWDVIGVEFKYAAMDEDGVVYVFNTKPYIDVEFPCWISDSGGACGDILNIDTTNIQWDKSLTERPDCEQGESYEE